MITITQTFEPLKMTPITYTIIDQGDGYSRVESEYATLSDVDNDMLPEIAGMYLAMGSKIIVPKHWPSMSEKPKRRWWQLW